MRLLAAPVLVIEALDYAQYLRVLGDVSNPAMLDITHLYLSAWLQ